MSKYCLQLAYLNKILKLKFPVFQHNKNFHKREEGKHISEAGDSQDFNQGNCLNVIHFYKTIFNKLIWG